MGAKAEYARGPRVKLAAGSTTTMKEAGMMMNRYFVNIEPSEPCRSASSGVSPKMSSRGRASTGLAKQSASSWLTPTEMPVGPSSSSSRAIQRCLSARVFAEL
jgi:hypothetical protein